jgi:hypothetical protein
VCAQETGSSLIELIVLVVEIWDIFKRNIILIKPSAWNFILSHQDYAGFPEKHFDLVPFDLEVDFHAFFSFVLFQISRPSQPSQ